MFLAHVYTNNHNNNNNKNGNNYYRDGRKLWEIMDILMAVMVVIVSWVYNYPYTNGVILIKCIVFYMSAIPQ